MENMNDYMDFAKSYGYELHFTGIGMAYLTIGGIKLTETKDVNVIRKELALLGMAIMSDTMRTIAPEDFSETEEEDEQEEEELSQEDYLEWCAASCGITYNDYTGKPWLD